MRRIMRTADRNRVAWLSVLVLLVWALPVRGDLDPNDSQAFPTGGYAIVICGNSIVFGNEYDAYVKLLLHEAFVALTDNLGFDADKVWVLVDDGEVDPNDDWTEGLFDPLPATESGIADTFQTIGEQMWSDPNTPRNLVCVIGGHGGRGSYGATSMRLQLADGMIYDYAFVSDCFNEINNNAHSGSPIERLDILAVPCYGGGIVDDLRTNFHNLRGTTWPNADHLSILTAGGCYDISTGLFGVVMVQALLADGSGVLDIDDDGALSIYEYYEHAARGDLTNPEVPYTPYVPEVIYQPSDLYFDIGYAEHPLYYEWNAPLPMVGLTVECHLEIQGRVDLAPEPNNPESPQYTVGTEVVLTAVPEIDGRVLNYWEIYDPNFPNDVSHATIDSNNPITIVMDSDCRVQAVFGCGSGLGQALVLLAVGALATGLISRGVRRRA